MNHLIQKYKQRLGIGALTLGVLLLVVGYLLRWTDHNGFTLPCLLLVIGGAVGHVVIMKRQSPY